MLEPKQVEESNCTGEGLESTMGDWLHMRGLKVKHIHSKDNGNQVSHCQGKELHIWKGEK